MPDPSTEAAALERLRRGARAAQQLCDVLWEALHEGLRDPDATRLADLSERLAEVSSTVAMLAPSAPGDAPSRPSVTSTPAPGPPIHEAPPASTSVSGVPVSDLPGRGAGERRTPPAPTRPAHSESSSAASTPTAYQSSASSGGEHTPTKLVDEQAPDTTAESLATVQPLQPEIAIRDVRREEGPSAWVSSVGPACPSR